MDPTDRSLISFKQSLLDNLAHRQGKTLATASQVDIYLALAYAIRDSLVSRWLKTRQITNSLNPKVAYYLSTEYLPGRQIDNNMVASGLEEIARQTLLELGYNLDDFIELETEPGLGSGGRGRLAACFLDSLASLKIPVLGYGLRYEYGMFTQIFKNGWQVEQPDDWLRLGDPWEFARPDLTVQVGFGGATRSYIDEQNRYCVTWTPNRFVQGVPYDVMVPAYQSGAVNTLRLWSARPTDTFDTPISSSSDFARAVAQKMASENISRVLYPDDPTYQGKMIRLQQQYFFIACSLSDILRRFLRHIPTTASVDWSTFPSKTSIQLNDTPSFLAIPELMRLLLDDHHLTWEQAWEITQNSFAITLHSLLPESIDEWALNLIQNLLPRHLEIIYEINRRLLDDVSSRFPYDQDRVARMSIIREVPDKRVRMLHLAAQSSFSINSVSEHQSFLLQDRTLRDFHEMYPERFNNKTNGITPRRFIRLANPRLSALISSRIGVDWLTHLEQLRNLEKYADDEEFNTAWQQVKLANKHDLAVYIAKQTGIQVNPESLFDIMAKRVHGYKRQLLKILHVLTLYQRLHSSENFIVPRTVIFSAKASPGNQMAKLVIKLINSIAEIINQDAATSKMLQVVCIPNLNVSLTQRIYPAADLSEQISLAGKETSGAGSMKFALNGALTVGTLDGANIEIRQLVGPQNFFLFGLSADEALSIVTSGYTPLDLYNHDALLRSVLDSISSGQFSPENPALFQPIIQSLLTTDMDLVLADYHSYIDCQDKIARAYTHPDTWTRMAILNTARCGFFSSDRAVQQYSNDIWGVRPLPLD